MSLFDSTVFEGKSTSDSKYAEPVDGALQYVEKDGTVAVKAGDVVLVVPQVMLQGDRMNQPKDLRRKWFKTDAESVQHVDGNIIYTIGLQGGSYGSEGPISMFISAKPKR